MFLINGTPYITTADYMLTYKGKPFIIIPSWSIKPFSPVENYVKAIEQNDLTIGYRLLLNTMKSEVISTKKKVGMGALIIGLIVLAAGGYFLMKGGFN